MIPIKDFYCTGTPTEEELREALRIATAEHCVAHLKWFVRYDGWYERYVYEDTNIEEMNKQLRHIIYGM